MSSLVLELQRDALNRHVLISDLLRKALLVAKKLNISEFERWVNNEMNGYEDPKDIPAYRRVTGSPKYFNPYHGCQPILFEDPELDRYISKAGCWQGIAELENLLENSGKKSGDLCVAYPAAIQNQIARGLGLPVQSALIVSNASLVRVIDAVRTIILNWSIKLESDGIMGEGISFTPKEREVAEKASYNINNFYGNVQNPQIQQQPTNSSQVMNIHQADFSTIQAFLTAIGGQIEELRLSQESRQELDSEIMTALAQIISPKSKHGIIRESLISIRRILEGASGGVAAKLLTDYGPMLRTILG